MDHREAVLLEFHVANDFGNQRAVGISERGAFEARMKIIGDGRATNDGAALDDQRLIAGFGEIERGDQAVVACAENYDVASGGHSISLPCL